jgi:hypothetical protein
MPASVHGSRLQNHRQYLGVLHLPRGDPDELYVRSL